MRRSSAIKRPIYLVVCISLGVGVVWTQQKTLRAILESSSVYYGPTPSTDIPAHRPPKRWASHQFPRWPESETVSIQLLADLIDRTVAGGTLERPLSPRTTFYPLPYIVENETVVGAAGIRQRHDRVFVGDRILPTESIMVVAHETWRQNQTKWPQLAAVLQRGGSVPVIAWYGDFRGCNQGNFGNQSVPLLTVCAAVDCDYAFPLPNYKTVADSRNSSAAWDAYFDQCRRHYADKRQAIVWRGGLTGALDRYRSPRSRIARFALRHANDSRFDMGLTNVPDRHAKVKLKREMLGFADKIPMESFQSYAAVLDIDGNSWSSRFGRLLCFDAVIVKVEPMYVDYFYRQLTPWKHYVPVDYDLGNLETVADYVLDPENEEQMLSIKRAANEWCRTHMVPTAIAEDVLDVWEAYVGVLNRDPSWVKTWNDELRVRVATSDELNMKPLTFRPFNN